ncbi:HET-domain-containing protein, partial [Thozetella sp. PMI_491]
KEIMNVAKWLYGSAQEPRRAESKLPDFCKLRRNADMVDICYGCTLVETLFEGYKDDVIRGQARAQYSRLFHSSFQELDTCAQRCLTCRVFRQALLLRQLTTNEVSALKVGEGNGKNDSSDEVAQPGALVAVFAAPRNTGREPTLHVRIRGEAERNGRQRIRDSSSSAIFGEIQSWLSNCTLQHTECSNLRWSNGVPTRLIRIKSATEAVLVSSVQEPTKYVALSYCWGQPSSDEELAIVTNGSTTKDNVVQRHAGFSRADLPATIRDAVTFAERIGVKHLWVDSVCIVQDDGEDWARESALMHSVYGNSYVTLCVSSNDTATAPIFQDREAWSPVVRDCKLDSFFISCSGLPLDELRRHSPLSRRAWTLQEESLSPRVLYWSLNRVYWSCSRSSRMEGLARELPTTPGAQDFITSCRDDRGSLHEDWLKVVENYAKRSLTHESDRFLALSGLATRLSLARGEDIYLGGLWRSQFARDLSWSLLPSQPAMSSQYMAGIAPSWSWASLPTETAIHWVQGFTPAPSFRLICKHQSEKPGGPVDAIIEGSKVKSVHVVGRVRPLFVFGSQRKAWSSISRRNGTQEVFDLDPERNVYSVDAETGRILAYESRKKEVMGQLDYEEDARMIDIVEMDIYCLEIGQSVMLLLQPLEPGLVYKRIGISTDYRLQFFAGTPTEGIELR